MIPKHIIHLLSGGLDSVTLLYDLKGQGHFVHCLMFNYEQSHSKELDFAELHCTRMSVGFTIINLPSLGGLTDDSWIVPNRNAILLGLAANFAVRAKADIVTIGCNKEDSEMFPDCRIEFINSFNAMLKMAEIPVEVCAPYSQKSKAWIGGMAYEMGIKSDEIWTCYRGGEKPCGECPACKKLQLAFA